MSFLVHVGATVTCSHQGRAMATTPNPRVQLSGAPSVSLTSPVAVVGCALPPPPSGNGPCTTAQWLSGTTRVTSNGLPLVVQTSNSICAPSGTPLIVMSTQMRVSAL